MVKWSDEADTHSLTYFWGGESESVIMGVPKLRFSVTDKFHDELGLGCPMHGPWDGWGPGQTVRSHDQVIRPAGTHSLVHLEGGESEWIGIVVSKA